ncbi:MAG: DUF4286 family protein [Cellulophaga sp.]
MYIYNVTVNIEEKVESQWLKWMEETHIPDMLATGKFSHARMCKVLVKEEMGGTTYAVQYTTKDKETLQKYYEENAPKLQADGLKLFAGTIVVFRSELEIISEQANG